MQTRNELETFYVSQVAKVKRGQRLRWQRGMLEALQREAIAAAARRYAPAMDAAEAMRINAAQL